jgi:VIT1/CCC1 family predicted Fe2+/Mn2+ transporter
LIFLVAGIALFGLIVLYSAAGGSAQPWALKQAIVFLAFLGALAARAGGAKMSVGSMRVAFWGALAMVTTAGVGTLFGAAV